MHYRHKRLIAIIMILLMFLPLEPVYADDPGGAAFPSVDKLFNGQNTDPYLTKYKDNYHLDMVDYNFFKNPEGSLNGLANVIFRLQFYLGYFLVVIFYYAFEIDLYHIFENLIGAFIIELKMTMFDEFSIIAIALLGVFYAIKVIQDQKVQIWVALIQTVIVVALAMYFFTHPMDLLKNVDEGSKALSQLVLAGAYKAGHNGNSSQNSAVMAAANDIWMMFVHKPWQLLEFGDTSLAGKEEKNILSYPPGAKERKEHIKRLAKDNKHFTPDWGAKRLGFMIFYLPAMLAMALCILFLCLLILAYQLLTILYALFGVFVFVIALIPFFGISVVKVWLSKIIGSSGIKVVVCFCLGIMFAFNSALFKVADVYGWIVLLFLQIVIVFVIVWKKDSLFDFFTAIRLAPQNTQAFNRQLRRDPNVEGKIREYAKNTKIPRIRRSNSKEPVYKSKEEKKKEENTAKEKWSKPPIERQHDKDKSKDPGFDPSVYNNQLYYSEPQEDTKNNHGSFKQLMKKAEEILQKQYELSKSAAENKAEKMGKEPEYTPWVHKVNTREALGAPKFEQKEIVAAARELERVLKAGGRPEDLYSQEVQKTQHSVQRPNSVMEIIVNGQKTVIDIEEADKIEQKDMSEEYVREFNRNYDTKYDKAFMEKLIRKYGQYQVREILDRMKELQAKNGHIKNPAGYLTQSLKNSGISQEKIRSRKQETSQEVENR